MISSANGAWCTIAIFLVFSSGACDHKDSAAPSTDAAFDAPVTVSAAVGAPQRIPVPPDVAGICNDICNRTRPLKCKQADECLSNCIGMGSSLTPCQQPINAFLRCLMAQPVENWECGEDDVAAVRIGFCDKEQEAVADCMNSKMKPQ